MSFIKKFARRIFHRNKAHIAIDLGSSLIKVAELKMISGMPVVTRIKVYHTPDETFGSELNESKLIAVLENIVEECGMQNMDVISSMWGDRVITRHINIPVMPTNEMKKAVFWEAKKLLPLPLDSIVMDFVSLGKIESNEHILMAAVSKNNVYSLYHAFKEAGINLVALDIKPFALWRVFCRGWIEGFNYEEKSFAVVDIGTHSSHILFILNGSIDYTRTIPAGVRLESNAMNYTKNSNQFHNGFSELITELSLSIDYYNNIPGKPLLQNLVITGGISKLKELQLMLADKLNLEIEPGYVTINTPEGNKTLDPEFAIVVGLALREVEASA